MTLQEGQRYLVTEGTWIILIQCDFELIQRCDRVHCSSKLVRVDRTEKDISYSIREGITPHMHILRPPHLYRLRTGLLGLLAQDNTRRGNTRSSHNSYARTREREPRASSSRLWKGRAHRVSVPYPVHHGTQSHTTNLLERCQDTAKRRYELCPCHTGHKAVRGTQHSTTQQKAHHSPSHTRIAPDHEDWRK